MDFSGRRFSSDCSLGNIHASVVVAGPGERQTGCAGTQNAPLPAPSVRLIPQTLTIPVTPPPFPDTPTWRNLGIWGDRLLDALETCNADKRAIELLGQRRLQRLNNEDNNHAEN